MSTPIKINEQPSTRRDRPLKGPVFFRGDCKISLKDPVWFDINFDCATGLPRLHLNETDPMTNIAPAIFICGTDTGVGKTTVAALLLALMREAGLAAAPMKPVETGCAQGRDGLMAADLELCLATAGMHPGAGEKSLMAPFRFRLPASPHLAARHEGRRIVRSVIERALAELQRCYRPVLIEGAGGLMVPLHGKMLTVDLVKRWKAPVILVARSGLGTINHSLLSLDVLRRNRIPVIGIVFNDGPEDDPRVAADNIRCIPRLGNVRCLGRIPYDHKMESLLMSAAREPAALERLIPQRRQWIRRVVRYAE